MTANILLLGYGAVGIIYAYILENSGKAKVTVIARSNYEAAAKGLAIDSQRFGQINSFKPWRVAKALSDDGVLDVPYDYVIVTTKAVPEVLTTPDLLAPFLEESYPHPLPIFVLLQNGLGVERGLYDRLHALNKGPPRILTAAIYILTIIVRCDLVEHGQMCRAMMGAYRPEIIRENTSEENEMIKAFGDIIEAGGGTFEHCVEVQEVKFGKNMWNVTFGAISGLVRNSPAVFLQDAALYEKILPVVRATLEEVRAVGIAIGYSESALPPVETAIAVTRDIYLDPRNTHKPSTLLDIECGKPFELEVIVGEVVRMGERVNMPMPRMELIYALLSIVQRQAMTTFNNRRVGA